MARKTKQIASNRYAPPLKTLWAVVAGLILLYSIAPAEATERGQTRILPSSALKAGVRLTDPAARPPISINGWRLLACTGTPCAWYPVTLDIPENAGAPLLVRARLSRGKLPRGAEQIVLVQSSWPNTVDAPLARFTPRTPRTTEDAALGTTGVFIDDGRAERVRIVPRAHPDSAGTSPIRIYAETASIRQALGSISPARLEQGLKTRDFLRFAGDLDGDGQLDFITLLSRPAHKGERNEASLPGEPPRLRLWLSQRAATEQLVGLAGELHNFEEEAE